MFYACMKIMVPAHSTLHVQDWTLVPKTVLGIFELILLFKAVLCCVLHSGLMKEYVQCSVSRGPTVWEISYTVAVSVILLMGIMHLNFPAVGVHSGH